MPGLDRSLVENLLLIKSEFHFFQQPPKIMSKEVDLKVKDEIEKLLKAKFIIPIRLCAVVGKHCPYDEEK